MSADQQGRQRHLLAQTQVLAEEIRSLPLDPESTRRSHQKLIELARLARRFVVSIDALPEGDGTVAMWRQRGQWLQEE